MSERKGNRKIETLYEQGTSERIEDRIIVKPHRFGLIAGVIDGTSAPFSAQHPQLFFDGCSGGEMAANTVAGTISLTAKNSLEEIILDANDRIARIQTAGHIPIRDSGRLAAASFAFAQITNNSIEIVQGADCAAVWSTHEGETGITALQNYFHEIEATEIIKRLLTTHNGDRKKMWIDFYPELLRLRRKDYNQLSETGFAVLNGQPWIQKVWCKTILPLNNIEYLILCSDGFIPFVSPDKRAELAKEIIRLYQQGGLQKILENTRTLEKKTDEKEKYISLQEASAIAIKFLKYLKPA